MVDRIFVKDGRSWTQEKDYLKRHYSKVNRRYATILDRTPSQITHRYTIYGNEVGLFTGGQMRVEIKGMSFEKGLYF